MARTHTPNDFVEDARMSEEVAETRCWKYEQPADTVAQWANVHHKLHVQSAIRSHVNDHDRTLGIIPIPTQSFYWIFNSGQLQTAQSSWIYAAVILSEIASWVMRPWNEFPVEFRWSAIAKSKHCFASAIPQRPQITQLFTLVVCGLPCSVS